MPAAEHPPEFQGRARLFGEKVRHAFDERGLTQRELIERTLLSRGYVKLLLNNRGSHRDPHTGDYGPVNPTLDIIWRLADALEVDPAYLVDDTRPVERRKGEDQR